MLRINTFSSAAGAIDYFNESLTGDYYSQDETTIGVWGGKGSKRLGFEGSIDKKDFQRLINNRDRDEKPLRPRWTREGRSGFDFTWDVPKSVSILYELTQNPEILRAFEEASSEVMEILEKEAAVRVRRDGANHDQTTGELTWSRFTHHSSRPVAGISDPHLHAHFFVHNLSWTEEEQDFRALQVGEIKASAYYYEALHHSKVAEKLAERGFQIERRGKAWEIAGCSDELIAKFSRRKEEIEAEIQKQGLISDRLKSEIGAKSRSKKETTHIGELRQKWKEKLSPEELRWLAEASSSTEGTSSAQKQQKSLKAADIALEHAKRDWFANNSLVEERRLLAAALRHSAGEANLADLEKALDRNDLIRKTANGKRYFTTSEVEAEERAMLKYAREGKGSLQAIAEGKHHFTRDFLNVGQRAAVEHVLNSKDRITVIRGAAGTGKTTLMQETIEEMSRRGVRVRTFAPSSDASRLTLRKEGFQDAETLAMLLLNEKIQESIRGGVIWVDEAGMIGTRDMWKLCQISKKLNARVVLSGDYRQHSAVQRGDSLRILVEHQAVSSSEVTEILRQRGEYRRAIEELSHGRVGEGFEILEKLRAIREIEDDEARSAKVANDYVTLLGQGRKALVVSPTHKEAKSVTWKIRQRLREEGKLKGEEKAVYRQVNRHWGEGTKSDPVSYTKGDIIQFVRPAPGFQIGDRIEITGRGEDGALKYRNLHGSVGLAQIPLDKPERFQVYSRTSIGISTGDQIRITQGGSLPNRYRLENGSLHEVKKVTENGELELTNGVIIPKHWGNIDYAYVSTSYSSQGKTVDEVLISQSADSFPASSREQFYVSSSRGRENLRIYTNSKSDLLQAVGVTSERIAAIEAKPDLAKQAEVSLPKKETGPELAVGQPAIKPFGRPIEITKPEPREENKEIKKSLFDPLKPTEMEESEPLKKPSLQWKDTQQKPKKTEDLLKPLDQPKKETPKTTSSRPVGNNPAKASKPVPPPPKPPPPKPKPPPPPPPSLGR